MRQLGGGRNDLQPGDLNETGIEDQSHDGGFHGLRLRMISSRSAANSESRTGDSPVSSSYFLANAIHSEIDRPRGTAGRTTATGAPPLSLSMITSAPARTGASTEPKSLSASASETCITVWLMRRLYPYFFPSPLQLGAQQVDDVVSGDDASQRPVFIEHGEGEQVVLVEEFGNGFLVGAGMHSSEVAGAQHHQRRTGGRQHNLR